MSSVAREMVAAGPGCALANGLLNGFETTKVKMQLQNLSNPVYRSTTTAGVMRQIVQEDGVVRGLLLPGLSASLLRSLMYGAFRVGLYSSTRDWLASRNEVQNANSTAVTVFIYHRLISGMTTGALGAILTCPLDVIRTCLQADAGQVRNGIYTTGLQRGKPARYTSIWSTVAHIIRHDGWGLHGLYRGAPVTVARASVLNGAQLASYDTLKRALLSRFECEEGPFLHVVCAFWSGVVAQTVVMPIDTVKSSLMVGQTSKSIWERLRGGAGLRWLFRGWLPAATGQGLIMVLQMPIIEQFRHMLGVAAI